MYEAHGIIRDYDPSSDTATVELVGIGTIDTWISGMRVHQAINRGALGGGVPCTVQMPDAHRICEATIVNLYDTTSTTQQGGSGQVGVTGRTSIVLNGSGAGTATIPFGHTFAAAPTVTVSCDYRVTVTISSVTTTGFTCTVNNITLPNGTIQVTWYAVGT